MSDVAGLLNFVTASPTPFHCVLTAVEMLREAGFTRLDEREPWILATGGRHYVVRADSSIVAFIVGTSSTADAGFLVIGAHTDSPNLRLKPIPEITHQGYNLLGVETYGGVLLSTWTDRDLAIAGRVMVQDNEGIPRARLWRCDRPLARVPQLAIHLDREVNDRGLILNKETHMRPVLGLSAGASFMEWLAHELHTDSTKILGFDLMLHDVQPPVVSGLEQEFIHAPRLDNQASCHAALAALTAAAGKSLGATRVVALYDHEEVGSASVQGASGSFLGDVMTRISAAVSRDVDADARARARSWMISADMAHAVHPNYAEKHEGRHGPRLNQGPVIKMNANARYATDGETQARFAAVCRDVDVPYQQFVMRADMACGSTIGPIVATRLGIRTVDVGNPMLSMHSCRELSGAADHSLMVRALTRFFS